MARNVEQFDSLPQGAGYADVASPATDAADERVSSTQHVPDSINDPMQIEVASIATQDVDGPQNVPPAWNSGYADPMNGRWPADVDSIK